MTKERIAQIRALLENATPGPWEIYRYRHGGGRIGKLGVQNEFDKRALVADTYNEGDRELLYAAPTIIAELLSELDRLTMERDEARQAAIDLDDMLRRRLGIVTDVCEDILRFRRELDNGNR